MSATENPVARLSNDRVLFASYHRAITARGYLESLSVLERDLNRTLALTLGQSGKRPAALSLKARSLSAPVRHLKAAFGRAAPGLPGFNKELTPLCKSLKAPYVSSLGQADRH